jgi:hypothetical protein
LHSSSLFRCSNRISEQACILFKTANSCANLLNICYLGSLHWFKKGVSGDTWRYFDVLITIRAQNSNFGNFWIAPCISTSWATVMSSRRAGCHMITDLSSLDHGVAVF